MIRSCLQGIFTHNTMPIKPLLINLVICHFLSLPFSLTYFFRRRISKPKAHAFRNPIKQIQESVFLFPFFLISRIMLGTRHAPFCAQPRSASHLHRYYRCCRWRRGTRKGTGREDMSGREERLDHPKNKLYKLIARNIVSF